MDWDTIVFILAVIVLIIGLALAFFGRAIWAGLLAAIGGMIGWMIGFAVGAFFFWSWGLTGILITIIIAFVGSFIMGAIFGFLVELALSLSAGLLAAGLYFYIIDRNIMIALIVFAVVFILAYVFIEKVVIVVTAFMGAVLATLGVWFITNNMAYTGLALAGVFVGGCLIQYFLLDDYDSFLL